LLFYEFDVEVDKNQVGRIKASANKVLGPAVWTIETGKRLWDPEKGIRIASEMFEKEYNMKPTDVKLVCYCYPKIGILASVKSEGKLPKSVLIDVATHTQITVDPSKEQMIGSGVYSVFDSIPEKDKLDRIKKWERENQIGQEYFVDLDLVWTVDEIAKKYEAFQVLWSYSKRLGLTLNGQQHCVWCAPTTGQMLLRYFHYYYEQPDIVAAMHTIWNPGDCFGGTYISDIVNGIEELSRNYIDSSSDSSPTWVKARDEINKGNPLGNTIWGHIRACDGYSWERFPWSLLLMETKHYLYILDPWPPNANNTFCNSAGGAEYWEDWDTITHYYHVYCRPCQGTMTCTD